MEPQRQSNGSSGTPSASAQRAPPRTPNAGSKTRKEGVKNEQITVFVATCQIPIFEASANADVGEYTASPTFKAMRFPTHVLPTAKSVDLQSFSVNQWVITKNPFVQIPSEEQFFTFKGRLLRLDGTLDAYYEY
ncbi:hypothetical protein FI667_g14520, partial [Globisporangium splendens]